MKIREIVARNMRKWTSFEIFDLLSSVPTFNLISFVYHWISLMYVFSDGETKNASRCHRINATETKGSSRAKKVHDFWEFGTRGCFCRFVLYFLYMKVIRKSYSRGLEEKERREQGK